MIKRMAVGVALAVAALSLTACESVSQRPDPLAKNVVDETNLNSLMLQSGDPAEAVRYFQQALQREPDRTDFRRGLAISLTRAKRLKEAAQVYQQMVTLHQDEPQDRLEYGYVLVRLDRFDEASTVASTIPAGMDTPRRYMLDAMLADQKKDWKTADADYKKAVELSNQPAKILNNWGVSKMARGDLTAAGADFQKALSYDSGMFSAKNNLVISRGLQGEYTLPIIPMTDEEKAILLNNLGIIAMRKGNEKMAKGLFAAAVEANPKHYAGAADRLAALQANVQY